MPPDAVPAFDFATLTPTEGVRTPTPHDRAADRPGRHCCLGALLFAVLLHGYALTVLPAVMDLDWPEDEIVDLNITNDDISFDPDLPTSYNIDRIEEVTVPGPGNTTDNLAQFPPDPQAEDDGPPWVIPPPPGFSAEGQAGGIDLPGLVRLTTGCSR